MRVSRICAWNTSRLAYDGSGAVIRDWENHSLCTFQTGKRYNCVNEDKFKKRITPEERERIRGEFGFKIDIKSETQAREAGDFQYYENEEGEEAAEETQELTPDYSEEAAEEYACEETEEAYEDAEESEE